MDEEDKSKIDKEGDVKVDENQLEDENMPVDPASNESSGTTTDNKEQSQSEGESSSNVEEKTESSTEIGQEAQKSDEDKKEHKVIHKKDGRLHIYIRQDKYKGELKSKNWVGRLYIDGKQKISSSGTPNVEEAIPILEKWFDDIQTNKEKEAATSPETPEVTKEEPAPTPEPTTPPAAEAPKQTEAVPVVQKAPEPVVTPVESNKPT